MSEKTQQYVLIGGKHGRYEGGKYVIYRQGQTIDLTESQAKSLRGKVQLAIGGTGEKVPLPDGWQDMSAADRKQLASKISKGKVSNAKEADEILTAYENE